MAIQNWEADFVFKLEDGIRTQYTHSEFVVDTSSDLSSIDTDNLLMGSLCYCIGDGKVYVLGSDGNWS